jgi:hypothetical protein
MTTPFVTYEFPTADAGSVGNERSLPDRLADVTNVTDYGAAGDGVTDDLAAIMAAYNHGRVTLFPSINSSSNIITFATSVPATVQAGMRVFNLGISALAEIGRVEEVSGSTVRINGSAVITAGDELAFNASGRGTIFFPAGTYYVSGPINISQESSFVTLLGTGPSSLIIGNFADYIIKRGGDDAPFQSVSGGHVVENLGLINSHIDGGGIRMGLCVGASIRGCNIVANKGISNDNIDAPSGGAFYGSLEFVIENCDLRAYDELLDGSWGIASGSDGPITNCILKDYHTGIRTFGGNGGMIIIGCRFQHNNYGFAGSWGPNQDTWYGPSAPTGSSVIGSYFKDNGVGLLITAPGYYRGNSIEATEGSIPGNPQYGALMPGGGGNHVSGLSITGQYEQAGFGLTPASTTSSCSLDGIHVENTSTLDGVDWIIPVPASSGQAINMNSVNGCNVAPVFTMAQLPAFPIGISSASWSGGTTTLNLFRSMRGLDGHTITIAVTGVTPSGYNGTFTGVVAFDDSVSYSQSDPGSPTGTGGTIIFNDGPAALPGDTFNVSDADTATWGAIPVGSGSTHAKVRWGNNNGAWTVVGK